ncbi:MAG: VOC family protein [Parvularculaceae bacterium]|nr:VOC family protein [Parvularculaceae bacterium]
MAELSVSIPVENVGRSRQFYEALGFVANPQFTNEDGAMMRLSDAIFVMLVSHEKWATLTKKQRVDPRRAAQVGFSLWRPSGAAVDATADAAIKAGGKADPAQDHEHGFMYGRCVEDPDGAVWDVMWMDPAAMAGAGA